MPFALSGSGVSMMQDAARKDETQFGMQVMQKAMQISRAKSTGFRRSTRRK